MSSKINGFLTCLTICGLDLVQGLDFCKNNKWCKQGHCCGDGHCCTYYYELWWFWLVWLLVAALLCCCFYQQKKIKLRPLRRGRRRRSIQEDRFSYEESWEEETQTTHTQTDDPQPANPGTQLVFKPMFDPAKPLVLPSYDDVEQLPKDPPAYTVLFDPEALPSTPLPNVTSATPPMTSPTTSVTSAGPAVTSHGQATSGAEAPPEYRDSYLSTESLDDSMTACLLENEHTPSRITGRLVIDD